MDNDGEKEEPKYILDISRPSSSRQTCFSEIESFDQSLPVSEGIEYFYEESTEHEQILVNKFLDGELNFSEYIENVEHINEPNIDVTSTSCESQNKVDRPTGIQIRSRKPVRKLPPALKGLMGEANLRFARGDKETAVKICLEIIRQVPAAPEPFLTLAGIYEEKGDEEKYLQMSLVAAHLSSTDAYEWIHLAQKSEKLGHLRQAVTCYSKAININIFDIEIHHKRAALLEKLGDKKTAIRGYIKLLTTLMPDQGEQILSVSKFVAEICYKENDIIKASTALDVAFEKCPSLITVEFVNLQLELLIHLKNYLKCLELLKVFCGLEIISENNQIVDCNVSAEVPIDIITKLIVVLIHLKSNQSFMKLLKSVTDLNPSEAGDLYLDIIDAFIEEHYFVEADNLLSVLIRSDTYSLPVVWLKYAENLKALNRLEDSVNAYYRVIEKTPQLVEAKMTLGALLVQLGRPNEAIAALTQNEDNDYLDVGLLYERCILLKQQPDRVQELIMVGQILFSRHSTQIRNRDELSSISIIQRYDKKRNAVKLVRKMRKEQEEDNNTPAFLKENVPSIEEEWELFKYICNVCIKSKSYAAFQRLAFTAQLSILFHVYKYEIDLLCVISSFYNKDSHNGYNIIRTLVVKEPHNIRLWHLFNLIITKSDDSRHHRFIMRQLARNCDHPALAFLHGNNCLVSGTYKYAMHEYSSAFVKQPTALGALLLGLTYLQMAAQKFTSKKHHLVIQALALLTQYKSLRGPQALQEVHYNLGRGFHHLGIFTQAIFHYKKALEYHHVGLAREEPDVLDLSREAAFNLHLIYCQSESYGLAKMYLERYIIV